MATDLASGKKNWKLLTLIGGILLLLLAGVTGLYFREQAKTKITSLLELYRKTECEQAVQIGSELNGFWGLGINANQKQQLGDVMAECAILNQARDQIAQGNHAGAYQSYSQLREEYPSSSIHLKVMAEAQDTFVAFAEEESGEGHYQNALEIYIDVFANYPKPDLETRAKAGYLDAFKKWVGSLYGQKQYEKALTVCREWSTVKIPETNTYYSKMAPTILWDWGRQLEAEKRYEEALDKYLTLKLQYTGTDQGKEAEARIPKIYYEWGVDLVSRNLKTEALQKFLEALKLLSPTDPVYQDIWNNYPETFIAYASWLQDEGRLVDAVSLLDQLKQADFSAEIVANVNVQFDKAVELLAGDEGKEGQKLIAQAKKAFCGKKSTVFISPAIDFFLQNPGRALFCSGGEGYYPQSLSAATPGELRYYVKFSAQQFSVQTCNYTDGYILTRMQYSLLLEIRYAKNMKYYSSRLFYGSTPPNCPSVYWFASKNESLFGGSVNKQTVIDWLLLVIV